MLPKGAKNSETISFKVFTIKNNLFIDPNIKDRATRGKFRKHNFLCTTFD